ncbi:hypothetical protein ACFU3J_22570 [Streptomyces sp. NPDC057411]|uniref:hypothetical protein n=1 Tax=unclassified Streptomyces TaxID=2593676 RepID=UPI003632887F
MRHTPDSGTAAKEEKKRFDLSVAQVSGSAVAAVVAAKLASTLGVYGTILGAGVISVIATCGGPLLQHLFKRTGEQMREATAATRPKTAHAASAPASHAERPYSEEFGEPTTHGTRMRGWKRSAAGAAAVFLIAMGGITAYELTSGQDLSGTKGTTTFGSAVRGSGAGQGQERPDQGGTPSSTPSEDGRQQRKDGGTATPDTTPTGRPTPDDPVTPTPTPTPSRSTEPTDGGTTPPPTPPPTTPPTAPPTAEAPAAGGAE